MYDWSLFGPNISSAGYGEPCVEDNDCYAAFSYESLSCVEQKCICAEGYYLVGRSHCRRLGNGEWKVAAVGDWVLTPDLSSSLVLLLDKIV
jgi:hypothetical protein